MHYCNIVHLPDLVHFNFLPNKLYRFFYNSVVKVVVAKHHEILGRISTPSVAQVQMRLTGTVVINAVGMRLSDVLEW